jgi:hypothetical protein
MGRPDVLRRALTVAVGLAVAAALVGGCAHRPGAGDNGGPDDTTGSQAAGVGGAGGDSTGTPGPGDTAGGGNSPAPPTYPNDAKGYAQATINAWVGGQSTRLGQLAESGAVSQFGSIQGHPDTHWQYIRCDGAAGSSHCTFRNNNGDQLDLRVVNENLGKQRAVAEVVYDRTTYAGNATDYVSAFLGAWFNGNRQRMLTYANSKTVDFLSKYSPLQDWTPQNNAPNEPAGHTYVFEAGSPGNGGGSFTFKVLDSSLGKAHAIECASVSNNAC